MSRAQTNIMKILAPRRASAGFTLTELMIAMAIGLLATVGIVSLFGGTSRTNQLQAGLARLQESGRFAAMRIEEDLRMSSSQYCSNYSGNRHVGPVAPMWQDRAPFVYAQNLNLPDSGGMQSVNPVDGALSTGPAVAAYGLSSRFYMQGFSCTTTTTCTPALWNTGMFPTAGISAGNRVRNSDILTIRYLRGTGWPISGLGNCTSGGSITVAPQTGDDNLNFAAGNLALVSDCGSPSIIPISGATGNVLSVGTMLTGAGNPVCGARGQRDIRVFNFSRDFVTVSYYLGLRANDNPDARPNAGAERLVPVLIRRENGVEQELVRGVDRLDFRYGVRDNGGNLRFLTAAQVDNRLGGTIGCPPKPDGVAPPPLDNPTVVEPGCLWRSVRRVEAHMLVNSGDEVGAMDAIGRSYRYMGVQVNPAQTDALPSGLLVHNYPRREFIAHATARNKNP